MYKINDVACYRFLTLRASHVAAKNRFRVPLKLAGEARRRPGKKEELFTRCKRPATGQSVMKCASKSSGPVDRARVSIPGIYSTRPPIRGDEDPEGKKKQRGEKTGTRLNKHVLQERRSA